MDFIDLFLAQNPWQAEEKFTIKPFIKREVYDQSRTWLTKDEIITITGPRQAGKTTILLKLIEFLIHNKKEPANSIYYFNFDIEEYREEFKKPQALLSFVQSRAQNEKYWLFLDEVQRLPDAGLFLKILYDLPQKPFKMIVSGSSSLSLRAKTKEYLTGRQIEFMLLPLSFKEGAFNFGFNVPTNRSLALQSLLENLCVYGGYPKPFLEKNPQIKQQLLNQLYKDYVKKDILDFAGIEKVTEFNKLTALLSHQIGNLVNINELATKIQTDIRTVKKYLELLEQTYVIKLLLPYFTNRRKEIIKSPKVYYLDNGLRNAQLNNFAKYDLRPDKGGLFENFVLTEIVKNLSTGVDLRYWRTQAGAEVDFVLINSNNITPIETKSTLKHKKLTRSLRSFIDNYKPERAFVASNNLDAKTKYKDTIVRFIPLSKLLEITSYALRA